MFLQTKAPSVVQCVNKAPASTVSPTLADIVSPLPTQNQKLASGDLNGLKLDYDKECRRSLCLAVTVIHLAIFMLAFRSYIRRNLV